MQNAIDNKFDLVQQPSPSSFEKLEKAGFEVENIPSGGSAMLVFNTMNPPFDDVRVRQAIMYAIDVDGIIEKVMEGYAKSASCVIPNSDKFYKRASNVYIHNMNKATQLLQEAGCPQFRFNLLNFGEDWGYSVSAKIKTDLFALGLQADIVTSDYD